MAAYARATNKTNEYIVGIGALDGKSTVEEEYLVVSDPSDQMVSCTCRQFKRCGIMCSHALKVLTWWILSYYLINIYWRDGLVKQDVELYKISMVEMFWKTEDWCKTTIPISMPQVPCISILCSRLWRELFVDWWRAEQPQQASRRQDQGTNTLYSTVTWRANTIYSSWKIFSCY